MGAENALINELKEFAAAPAKCPDLLKSGICKMCFRLKNGTRKFHLILYSYEIKWLLWSSAVIFYWHVTHRIQPQYKPHICTCQTQSVSLPFSYIPFISLVLLRPFIFLFFALLLSVPLYNTWSYFASKVDVRLFLQ